VKNFIICLILPLSIFQDVALQHFGLGVLGGSLAILPISLLVLFNFLDVKKLGTFRFSKHNLIFPALCFFVCINFYFAHKYNYVGFGENLIIKSLKMAAIYGTSIYCFYLFRSNQIRNIGLWIKGSFFLAATGLMVDLIYHDAMIGNWWLHYTLNENAFYSDGSGGRLKGLSLESSTLGLTLLVFGLLSAMYSNNNYSKFSYVIFTVVLCYFSESKAALPLIIFSLFASVFWARSISKSSKYMMFASLSLVIYLSGKFFIEDLSTVFVQNFIYDIEQSTSVATRGSLFLASFASVANYPLGVGFSGYMHAITAGLAQSSDLLSMLIGFDLNMDEIYSMTYGNSDYAISAKTLFAEGLIILGIPFLVAWFWLHLRLLAALVNKKEFLGLVLILALSIALTLYNNGQNMYFIAAAYGLLARVVTFKRLEH
jgi:hypothetical protein